MKSMNVKRIAATALGAAMIGAAFAGAVTTDPGLSNFKFFTGNEPNVKIVVGSAAQPTDAVAAANIAAMIGNLAYTSSDITVLGKDQLACDGTGNVSGKTTTLEVTTPGVNSNVAYQMKTYIQGYLDRTPIDDRINDMTGAYTILATDGTSGGRKITNYDAPALVFKTTVTDTQVSKSYTEDERYFTYAYTTYDTSAKKVKAKNGQVAYEAQFTNPIQVCSEFTPDDSTCSDTYRTSKHRVKIKFLGSDWVIYGMDNFPTAGGVTASSTALTIGKEVAYKEFMQIGDEATAPNGIKIVLKDISGFPTGTQYQPPVSFDIFDANGNQIDTATLQEGGTSEYNKNGVVVIVWKAFAGIGQTAYAQVSIFSDKLTLTHGTVVDSNNQQWQVTLVGGGTSYGASLSRLQLARVVVDDLNEGDSVTYIQKPQAMKLTYTGLEKTTYDTLTLGTGERAFPTSSTDTATTGLSFVRLISSMTNPFNFGTTSSNTLYYITDATPAGQGGQGDIFYQDPSTGYFRKYYGVTASTTITLVPAHGALTSSTLTGTAYEMYFSGCAPNATITTLPTNIGAGASGFTFNGTVTSANSTSVTFTNGANLTVNALNLSRNATCWGYLQFTGVAGTIYWTTAGNSPIVSTLNSVPYNYGPNTRNIQFDTLGITAGLATDPTRTNGEVIAIPEFQNDDDTNEGAFMFDVGSGSDTTPRLGPSSGTAYLSYNSTFTGTNTTGFFTGTTYESGYISPRGSTGTISLTSGSVNYATTLAHALYTLSGAAVAGAGNVAEVGPLKEGETGLDEAGYKVVVKTITAAGSGEGAISGLDTLKCSSEKAYVVTALNTANTPLVVTDASASATQQLIVIGGPLVNTVAAGIPGGDIAATAGSDAVVKVIGDKILVYGYTAADTTSAANAFIEWLALNAGTIQR